MDKWYGESNKIVDAIFSLANKLQPCIIFIDEIDSFLRDRQSTDHEVSALLKAEFMTLWDGLLSNGRIMTQQGAETSDSSEDPKDATLDDSFDLDKVVDNTNGYSGSDLRELCREAALKSMKEYLKERKQDKRAQEKGQEKVRPLQTRDFIETDLD
ncbi:hypothetical protein CJJ09_004864 [Candidozyma auris]|nr:hypothetical protein CJJ09_004864 [[Candida] auris]